ncbi:hypothetical protein [Alkalimonas mucilaginosa]|uniref:Uncharacterized protein n=1 Tax=Alkalimonas mucilaginosa TaxID=3057676 RepID=A0ABU7JH53_9GAMM|nr:hypothetical protein [Alkalimonas sp. MEB004]MEE2025024.1 hypothetical protein [Alkalimonas sp. MEB004]
MYQFEPQKDVPVHRGLVEIDIDIDAERYLIMHRRTLMVLMHAPVPASNIARVLVPFEHTNQHDLMVMILDDDNEYNMAGNDKVQAQLVDARTVNFNP